MSNTQPNCTALILPGGGARGAYQVGVLKAVNELTATGKNPFPIICGTSAGSINAAVLASHGHEFSVGVERLEQFWRSMYCARVYRTDAWTVFKSGMRFALTLLSGGLIKTDPRSFLDNMPLRLFLEKHLQLEGIQTALDLGELRGVAVTASGYSSATATSYFQAQDNIDEWQRTRRKGLASTLNVQHLLASAALPILFPAERIGNEYFGDGGMRMVAPLSPAIHLGANRIMVIGTRDEKPDLPPESPAEYPSAGEIGGYLMDTIFMDTLNADLARMRRINKTLELVPEERRQQTGLININSLVIKPSKDLRYVTQAHVNDIPRSVQILLRTLGGWGRDWRMASYLLFESAYCGELIDLGYTDGMNAEQEIVHFLEN
ncbi:MAG: patatin-like phospholipase family protein [Xanthomonadales bacterium]|nr:patatin-like phospholipase family protein [Xanthomonadales bacterium]